ncbi:MAG: acyltransferase [Planctomycetota bacterium]|jgi:UDP-2-acetamido-3-amino-2,3-dideoxy-glucuronate N-acetyltransferase
MASRQARVHPTAVVDDGARIGAGTRVWHFCHIMEGARIGRDCILGQNVFVGRNVPIGSGTKIQNNVSLYEGVKVGKGCFIGPSAVFTNVKTPRAGVARTDAFEPTELRDGATVGANATIVCGTVIGKNAVVGAGAVVTRDVPDHRVVQGTPARTVGWACRCGAVLQPDFHCGECRQDYRRRGETIVERKS